MNNSKKDSRRIASKLLLDSFLSGEQDAPVSEVRRVSELSQEVRRIRVDASLRATVAIPEAEYRRMIERQVVREVVGS